MLHGYSKFWIAYITSILLHSTTVVKYSHWIVCYESVSEFVFVSTHTHTHTHIYTYTHRHTHTYTHTHTDTHIGVHTFPGSISVSQRQ